MNLRIRSHKLLIETGRYKYDKVPCEERRILVSVIYCKIIEACCCNGVVLSLFEKLHIINIQLKTLITLIESFHKEIVQCITVNRIGIFNLLHKKIYSHFEFVNLPR